LDTWLSHPRLSVGEALLAGYVRRDLRALFRTSAGRAYLASCRQPLALELPITVTAKLSQAVYDRLGHQVADEMVDWFNQVDAAYRSDLRELNELNFARFDAKLEQRFAESALALDQRLSEFARGIEQQIARLALDLKSREVTLMRQQGVQMRWMIGMWLAVFLAVIGLWVRR
jgi:hypothetical protein